MWSWKRRTSTPTFKMAAKRPYEALDIVIDALSHGRPPDPPASAAVIRDVSLADAQIKNGGFSQLVYSFGVEALVRAGAGMRAIGATGAVPLFDSAIAIAEGRSKELERFRAGPLFGDEAPVGKQLQELNGPYFHLHPPVAIVLADYLLARDEPWYDAAVAAYARAGHELDLAPEQVLSDAVRDGHLGLARYALEALGKRVGVEILMQALRNGRRGSHAPDRAQILEAILDTRPPLDWRDDSFLGWSALHYAAENAELTAMMLARGADPHAQDKHGMTPLHMASASVVPLLVAAGVDPRVRDPRGVEPIHLAGVGAIAALLAAGATVHARTNTGQTPLHWLARKQDAGVAHALLAAGADAAAVDAGGATPLHTSCAECVPVLVAAGIAVDARDALGRTPLMTVDHADTIEALLAAGARADLVDAQGRGVLHFARVQARAVNVLAKAGARLDLRDASGRTPLERTRWNAERTREAYDHEEDTGDKTAYAALQTSGDTAGDVWAEALEAAATAN